MKKLTAKEAFNEFMDDLYYRTKDKANDLMIETCHTTISILVADKSNVCTLASFFDLKNNDTYKEFETIL